MTSPIQSAQVLIHQLRDEAEHIRNPEALDALITKTRSIAETQGLAANKEVQAEFSVAEKYEQGLKDKLGEKKIKPWLLSLFKFTSFNRISFFISKVTSTNKDLKTLAQMTEDFEKLSEEEFKQTNFKDFNTLFSQLRDKGGPIVDRALYLSCRISVLKETEPNLHWSDTASVYTRSDTRSIFEEVSGTPSLKEYVSLTPLMEAVKGNPLLLKKAISPAALAELIKQEGEQSENLDATPEERAGAKENFSKLMALLYFNPAFLEKVKEELKLDDSVFKFNKETFDRLSKSSKEDIIKQFLRLQEETITAPSTADSAAEAKYLAYRLNDAVISPQETTKREEQILEELPHLLLYPSFQKEVIAKGNSYFGTFQSAFRSTLKDLQEDILLGVQKKLQVDPLEMTEILKDPLSIVAMDLSKIVKEIVYNLVRLSEAAALDKKGDASEKLSHIVAALLLYPELFVAVREQIETEHPEWDQSYHDFGDANAPEIFSQLESFYQQETKEPSKFLLKALEAYNSLETEPPLWLRNAVLSRPKVENPLIRFRDLVNRVLISDDSIDLTELAIVGRRAGLVDEEGNIQAARFEQEGIPFIEEKLNEALSAFNMKKNEVLYPISTATLIVPSLAVAMNKEEVFEDGSGPSKKVVYLGLDARNEKLQRIDQFKTEMEALGADKALLEEVDAAKTSLQERYEKKHMGLDGLMIEGQTTTNVSDLYGKIERFMSTQSEMISPSELKGAEAFMKRVKAQRDALKLLGSLAEEFQDMKIAIPEVGYLDGGLLENFNVNTAIAIKEDGEKIQAIIDLLARGVSAPDNIHTLFVEAYQLLNRQEIKVRGLLPLYLEVDRLFISYEPRLPKPNTDQPSPLRLEVARREAELILRLVRMALYPAVRPLWMKNSPLNALRVGAFGWSLMEPAQHLIMEGVRAMKPKIQDKEVKSA